MKQIEAQIMGQAYVLACPEGSEDGLRDAVRRVDAAMIQIRDAGKIRARERIAVLAALNLAFELGQQPAQAPTVADTPATAPSADPAAPARLDLLLQRLDEALEQEPQLF